MAFILLLFGLLPGFVWLIFYIEEDTDSEPKKEILLAFIAGFAITIVVLFVQTAFAFIASYVHIADYSLLSFLGLAAIEEFFKFAAAYLVVSRSKYFDIPIDAMIYMIVVALGFATLENIFAIRGEFNNTALLSTAAETATLRFVGATLLHTLSSAIVGYYWAKAILHGRFLYNISIGLVIATILHTSFNCLISSGCTSFSRESPITYTVLLLIFAGFFVLNDFEKLKHPEKNTAPFFKKREKAEQVA
ncbi:MAG: PrsW family glutamic-type intramembrane protease [bacterium]|nr:PrsW family glutamic-type intramembrane protease [bacterium]